MNAFSIAESRRVSVSAVRQAAEDVRTFDLVAADGRPLAAAPAGAHLIVEVPAGLIRHYSLCGDPRDASHYVIAVKREAAGRGGSASMHQAVEPGSSLTIAGPRNNFPLAGDSAFSILIAGGIGITPLLAMAQQLQYSGHPWEMHYCARSAAHAAFLPALTALSPDAVTPYLSPTPIFDAATALGRVRPGTHVYCCGPQGLMQAVADATAHWPDGHVHFEWFSNPTDAEVRNVAFEVELARSGLVLAVPEHLSVLQVVRAAGIDVPSSCEEGVCGTCETRVLSGLVAHRDQVLSAAERRANGSMMICVSRAEGNRIVLDL
ncbi:MAG: PDR/VanB family oxidoreductase [Acetobacteraceae bacterium]